MEEESNPPPRGVAVPTSSHRELSISDRGAVSACATGAVCCDTAGIKIALCSPGSQPHAPSRMYKGARGWAEAMEDSIESSLLGSFDMRFALPSHPRLYDPGVSWPWHGLLVRGRAATGMDDPRETNRSCRMLACLVFALS